MQPSADEDNDDVIESFWLYIFSVFPSFVYYYLNYSNTNVHNGTRTLSLTDAITNNDIDYNVRDRVWLPDSITNVYRNLY